MRPAVRKIFLIVLLLSIFPAFAFAELVPKKGPYDPRVRIVEYNPLDVVKISTFYGVSTHIHFGENEIIKDVAVGDDLAWKVMPRGNNLFIKPQDKKADTNVTVVTNLRIYQFALIVQPRPPEDDKAWEDPNLVFSLTYHYPDEEAAKFKDAELRAKDLELQRKLSNAVNTGKERQNYDYWVAGSEEISPTAAHDDGRFIYLTFSNNRDMPAIYSVDEDESEALINTNIIEGNTIVIQRLVRRLMLRKGNSVASVLNKSFDIDGGKDNKTGTVAPDVKRVIKGEQ
jgi:type IV secretion system protein VirB9